MQQNLIDFFIRVLAGNESLLQQLNEYGVEMRFDLDGNELVFTLSGLYDYLVDEINLDYKEFRKLLYQGNINEELAKYGGRIEVYESTGNVDDSWYKLVKIKRE